MVKHNDRSTSLYNPNRSSLYWDNLGFSVRSKVILSECSGIVYSGQVVGIFGASGCGKSTFLNCLSGRIGKGAVEGNVLFNGKERIKKDVNDIDEPVTDVENPNCVFDDGVT